MASDNDGSSDSTDELQASEVHFQVESAGVMPLPASPLQHRPRVSSPVDKDEEMEEDAKTKTSDDSSDGDRDELSFEVSVPAPINRDEYVRVSEDPEDNTVDSVLMEVEGSDNINYKVLYADGREDIVSVLFIRYKSICGSSSHPPQHHPHPHPFSRPQRS